MHTPSLLVASAAVLSTFVSAEGEQRPRFYFPRHIKRPRYQNSTISNAPAQETSQDVISSSSTKRSVSDIFAGLSSSPSGSAGTTGDILASLLNPSAPPTTDGTDGVMTVTISQTTTTIVASDATTPTTAAATSTPPQGLVESLSDPLTGGAASTGGLPPVVVLPTVSTSTPSQGLVESLSDPLTGGAASTGVLPSVVVLPTLSTSTSSQGLVESLPDPLTGGAASTGGLPPIVLPTVSTSTTAEPTTSETPLPSSSAAGSGITFGPGGVLSGSTSSSTTPVATPQSVSSGLTFSGTGGSTATAAASSTASTPSTSPGGDLTATAAASSTTSTPSTSPGLVPVLGSLLTSVLESPTPTTSTTPATTTTPTEASTPATETPAEASSAASTSVEIPDPLASVVGSLTSLIPVLTLTPTPTTGVSGAASTGVTTSVVTPDPTDSAAPTTTSSTGLGGLLSSIIASESSILGSVIGSSAPTTTIPVVTPSPPTTTPAVPTTTPDPPESPSPPPGSTNSTLIGTSPPNFPTTVTTPLSGTAVTITSTPGGASPTGTPSGSGSVQTGNGTTIATQTPPATPVSTPDSAPSSSSSTIFSVFPTTTVPGTDFLPASIIAQPSASLAPGETPSSAPTAIPSGLPKVITNPNGTIVQPEDTTLVQIGFDCPLNYPFVVANSKSSAQIFAWLAPGLADGLNLQTDQVVIHTLVPLNTAEKMNCITTLALTYIPNSMVNTLYLDLKIPTALLYNNPDTSINELMNLINPAIPLIPGSTMDNGATGTDSGSAPTTTAATGNNGLDNTNTQTQSPQAAGTTAGFAMLAVGGAGAYGAAMFLVARRYKRRKQSHRRSSSVVGPEMRFSGSPALLGGGAGAFMSGGRISPGNDRNSRGSGRTGNSARTAQISAPMMAENSLGWN